MPTETLTVSKTAPADYTTIAEAVDRANSDPTITEILLHRGETFIGRVTLTRGNLTFASYGNSASPRPGWDCQGDNAVICRDAKVDNVLVQGIRFRNSRTWAFAVEERKEPGDEIKGWEFNDCIFDDFTGFQSGALFGFDMHSTIFRRCLFVRAGLYNEAEAHPFYMAGNSPYATCEDCVFIDCGDAGQMRSLHSVYQRNVAARCRIGVDMLGRTGPMESVQEAGGIAPIIEDNLFVGMERWGMSVYGLTGGRIVNNIVAHPNPDLSATRPIHVDKGTTDKGVFVANAAQGFREDHPGFKRVTDLVPPLDHAKIDAWRYAALTKWGEPGYTAADFRALLLGKTVEQPVPPDDTPIPAPTEPEDEVSKRLDKMEQTLSQLPLLVGEAVNLANLPQLVRDAVGDQFNGIHGTLDAHRAALSGIALAAKGGAE